MESIEDDDLTDLDLDYVPQGLEVLAEEIRSDINLSKNIDEEVNPITNSLGKDEDLDLGSWNDFLKALSERDAELSKQSAVINEGLDEILNTTGDSETKLSFNEEGKGVDEAKSETYGIESVTIITTSTSVVAASNENELFNEKMRSLDKIAKDEDTILQTLLDQQKEAEKRISEIVDESNIDIATFRVKSLQKLDQQDLQQQQQQQQQQPQYFGANSTTQQPVTTTADPVALDEFEVLKKLQQENKQLEYILATIMENLKAERDKHEKLAYQLDGYKSTIKTKTIKIKQLRAKSRDLQDKARGLVQWFKIEGRVGYEREKERGSSLLQRAAKILETRLKSETLLKQKIQYFHDHSELLRKNRVSSVTQRDEMKTASVKLEKEYKELKEGYDSGIINLAQRIKDREKAIKDRAVAEEKRKVYEFNLLQEACRRIQQNKSVPMSDLEILILKGANLFRLINLTPVPNVKYLDVDDNELFALNGIECCPDLSYLLANRNSITKLDLNPIPNLRFLSISDNKLTSILGVSDCMYLQWMELNGNPLRTIDFVRDSKIIKVLMLRNIKAPNLNALGTVNLLGLDLGGNHFFNEALSFLNDVGTLKYLALDDNLYTEMPEICNPLLYELKFQKNKLREFHFSSYLPCLRILRLEGNSLTKVPPLTMLPNLGELYLQENNINEITSVFSMTVCQRLTVLDLTKNPIAHHRDLKVVLSMLLPSLEDINKTPKAEFFKGAMIVSVLKKSHYCKLCKFHLESVMGEIKSDDLTFVNDCASFGASANEAIEDYYGGYKGNYLHYISFGEDKDEDLTGIMDLREKNIQWLTTITSDHHKTWNKMIERRKPNGLAIIQPWIEQIDEIVVELQVAYTQACWKKIQARKNYKKAVEDLRKVQTRWKKKLFTRVETVRKEEIKKFESKAATTISSRWKGYQTRKKVVKYKEEVEKARRDLQLQEEKMIRVEESSKQDGNVTKPQAPPVDAKDMREDASAISLAVVQETFFEEMNNDINIDEDENLDQWLSQTNDGAFDQNLSSYLENDHILKASSTMAIQQPTSNYRRPSIQNLELADFNNVKRSRSSSFSNQDDATASLSHNSQITTDKNAGSQVEQSNMLLHALKGFGVKSSKQQQQINFGPDTGNDSTDNIAEWELSKKESQDLLKKKQERFSAFEKKANLREVMRDPLQRFKIFQHRNCKKNDAIGGGDLDKNSHQPLQNVIYKYEWDIRYSPSQPPPSTLTNQVHHISSSTPTTLLPNIIPLAPQEFLHSSYPKPSGVASNVTLLINNFLASKVIDTSPSSTRKRIALPRLA